MKETETQSDRQRHSEKEREESEREETEKEKKGGRISRQAHLLLYRKLALLARIEQICPSIIYKFNVETDCRAI